jgi:hypothetical protein
VVVALAAASLVYHPQGWHRRIAVVSWVGLVAAAMGAARTLFGLPEVGTPSFLYERREHLLSGINHGPPSRGI